ncbi:SPOR domain-containing protein [Lichenihabitans sp. Uapishka_5]|uniref:D-alanyl-D-alanine carboxypeptidase n=1 Tax=Lichenihabitans sp. Uapishka_5 TaxID=3037302 RepID=UPI0029E7F7A2|nr:serine hydrolase [Lichenihabitans sp. Uapishka_5]MDX7949888.1 SPOR domain-containing protein [Lichenihabitans sp. Uapishka_5]
MVVLNSTASGRRRALAGLGLALALIASTTAEARGHHHGVRAAHARPSGSAQSSPAFAALVVDVNTGRTLYADRENELRHPASITKVMTLFLLFEKLQSGDISLDTRIPVSRHAASMTPTKLGLRPGSTIRVEDAIKAIVTKSANDMAVAVAEAVGGGDEDHFAELMTRKAHALGMFRTVYVNASGLPDNRQITTAHDLALLGRAIQDRFPTYYHFFSTPSFTYAGETMANHNHLMERVEGMDGIKTGYTNASGFNLLSNVNRGGHHIVAVVMGGKSAAGRDHIMEGLIAQHLEQAAPTRVAGKIEEEKPIEEPAATVAQQDDDADGGDAEAHDSSPTVSASPSLIAPTMAVPPMPMKRMRTADVRPAFVTGAPRTAETARGPAVLAADRGRSALDGSTSSRVVPTDRDAVTPATATPSSMKWVTGAAPARQAAVPAKPVRVASAAADDVTSSIRPGRADTRDAAASPQGRGDWTIQVGATKTAREADALLDKAKTDGRSALGSARPVTEKVRKGRTLLYRARFAGLGPDQAQDACRTLKRSGFACFATKD